MYDIPSSAVKEALGIAIAAKVPVLIWGAPGTGKSSAIRLLAESMCLPCETVIAAIREPSDFAGLPILADGEVRLAPPRWARRLADSKKGILFLDEISTAPPAVQAALLRVVLERTVGDLELPQDVVVVAAANPPDQAADGWDLSAPLANRFCHLDWTADVAAYSEGSTGRWPAVPVPSLDSDWEAMTRITQGLIATFMRARPSLICELPANASLAGKGWPSPRTWDMAARLMTASRSASSSPEAQRILVTGAVGIGAGIEFLQWLVEMDLPDPELVLADPEGYEFPTRGDRLFAVISSVVAAAVANLTEERWLRGWKVLHLAAGSAPDVAATAARVLAEHQPDGLAPPTEVKIFEPLLREAGIVK